MGWFWSIETTGRMLETVLNGIPVLFLVGSGSRRIDPDPSFAPGCMLVLLILVFWVILRLAPQRK